MDELEGVDDMNTTDQRAPHFRGCRPSRNSPPSHHGIGPGFGKPREFPKYFPCPECDYQAKGSEDFARHLERHREVKPPQRSKRGRPITGPCPKGCGRHFRKRADHLRTSGPEFEGEFYQHVHNCDGSEPLS